MFRPKILTVLCIIWGFSLSLYAQDSEYSYLALGDSYTIGESVDQQDRWPVQLVDSLQKRGFQISEPEIIAVTGWTTDELLNGIADASVNRKYDLVSLLIGVNNQYRGYEISQFRKEFRTLLEKAIGFAGGEASNVFVVSIPDYGATPFGQKKNPEKIATELARYNRISRQICQDYDVSFVNITPISKQAKRDSALVAEDNLHPSAKMYEAWINEIVPVAKSKLKR